MMNPLRHSASWCALLVFALAACGDHDHDEGHTDHDEQTHEEPADGAHGHDHPAGATSVTLWTERSELFMEYPDLVVGHDAEFLIHLTDLSDFSAVVEGALVCRFESQGADFDVTVPQPSRPGIYIPTVRFERAGTYRLELILDGPQVRDRITVTDVKVHAQAPPPPAEEEEDASVISFLKEQQWQIDFATADVAPRQLTASVSALGEILAGPRHHAEVPAQVHGIVAADQNRHLPLPGTWVEAGEVLAVISPPAETASMLLGIRNDYLLAQAELQRAERLHASQAAPQRRLAEARLRYATAKSSYDRITGNVDFADGATAHYHVASPIAGVVDAVHVHMGESVQPGDALFTVTDPRRVLLEARVPLAHYRQVGEVRDADFTVEGDGAHYRVSELDGRLISVSSTVDPESRMLPILFELANPDRRLKIHQFVEVALHTGDAVSDLAVPETALLDEGGQPVVYVQLDGEAFARRLVQTGVRDAGLVQILHGLAPGERVVTEGAYQVRLAALGAPTAGHGHAH